MDIHCTEGIILQSIPFQDYDQIVTVFSLEHGLLKFIIKRARSAKRGLNSAISPLTCAEFTFQESKGEIFKCRDIGIINLFLPLREELNVLDSACELLKAIQKARHPGVPSPDLYRLLKFYLEKMRGASKLEALVASFYLKILVHEGLLDSENPHDAWKTLGLSPNPEKLETIRFLATSRSFAALSDYPISQELKEEIKYLFNQALS